MIQKCLLLFLLITTLGFSQSILSPKGTGSYAITAFDRESSRQIGGYYDTEFISTKDSSTFRAHRLVLEMSSQLHPDLLFNTEIEFEYGANVEDKGEIKIEQLWMDYALNDALVNRFGIIVVPFGRLNILHDSDVRDASNRPIYAKYIVPSTWMDTGFGFHGNIDVSEWEFHYEAYLLNGLEATENKAITGIDGNEYGIRKLRPNFKTDNNENKALAARLVASPFLGLEIGTSLFKSRYDADDKKDLDMYGLDVFYKNGAYELVSEFAHVSLDPLAGQTIKEMSGYYVENRYHFPLKLAMLAKFKRPVLTLFARYSAVDTDTSIKNKYDRTQTTLGINFRPVETVVYKLEYEWNKEAKNESDNDAIVASIAVGF